MHIHIHIFMYALQCTSIVLGLELSLARIQNLLNVILDVVFPILLGLPIPHTYRYN